VPFPLSVVLLAAAIQTPNVSATRTDHVLVIDGLLDEVAWTAAAPASAFTQEYPFDGQPPTERTTMRILYDDDALYVGFACEHAHTPIIERLTRRDQDSESEWVSVFVDPRGEAKAAFVFGVNVSGVLLDAIMTPPNNWNLDWDENWEARAARTATGWSAEFRIPFRVLRYDATLPIQSWGFQAARYIAEKLVLQTVKGSVEYAQETPQHLARLRNQVTSPGGTSAEALYFLEKAGFRTALSRAIWAAYQRASQLGRGKKRNVQDE